jgi:hypothetical protein
MLCGTKKASTRKVSELRSEGGDELESRSFRKKAYKTRVSSRLFWGFREFPKKPTGKSSFVGFLDCFEVKAQDGFVKNVYIL